MTLRRTHAAGFTAATLALFALEPPSMNAPIVGPVVLVALPGVPP